VRQHRLADDVADREDVRRVGAHLLVGRDEAALDHQDTRVLGADQPTIGPAADRHQDAIEAGGRRRPVTTPRSCRNPLWLTSLERLQRAPDSLDPQPGLELGHSL
jgi:hypothetical protein